jgi:hypothetical protein
MRRLLRRGVLRRFMGRASPAHKDATRSQGPVVPKGELGDKDRGVNG